jgi:hypothetical protein
MVTTTTATVTGIDTIVRRMDARRGGRFRVETAHPTKVRAVLAGTPRMDAHLVTQFRVETARPTDMEDRQTPSGPNPPPPRASPLAHSDF